MRFFLIKYVFLILITVSVFSQETTIEREQGLITSDPFWRQALGGAVLSLPSVQAQSAVVALDGGNIRAYSTAGTPMWDFSARSRISPYVSRSREGTSYFSRTNGTLIAVNRAGRELWRRSLDNPLCARVVTGWDGRLFVPVNGKIYCYTASGTLLWTRVIEAPISIAPKLDRGGGILFALNNNAVYRIDPYGNAHVWMLSDTPSVLLSIEQQRVVTLYADGTVEVLGSTEDWFTSAQGEVQIAAMPRFPASPLAAVSRGNNIIATLNNGRVVFLSIDERKIIWTADSHIRELIINRDRPETEVEMIIDNRGIYVLNKNGATGFSHEGRRLWFKFLQNAAAIPAFGNDGVLYSGGRDWILYAYKVEDRVLSERNVLFGPVPEGNYGLGRPRNFDSLNVPLNEREIKAKINQISANLSAGRIGANEPAWTSFLLNVSAEQEPIQLRIAALNLLGKIGSLETVPWLVNIFRRDNEPMIRAEAVKAIGNIGVDPEGAAIQTFLYSLIYGSIKEEMVLTAIASATGALCRFSGPPLSETGVRILNLLTTGSMPSSTRRQANRELASLARQTP